MFSNRHPNDQAATLKQGRNRLAALVATLAVAGAGSVALAGPAAAADDKDRCAKAHFCAYEHVGYVGKLLESAARPGTKRVDVADDLVSSAKNQTSNVWKGMDAKRGRPDREVFRFGPHTAIWDVGSKANDKIDHFDVVSG